VNPVRDRDPRRAEKLLTLFRPATLPRGDIHPGSWTWDDTAGALWEAAE
jgi:hypothetical protein